VRPARGKLDVLIVGAGVAGIETAIAVTKYAPGICRLTLLTDHGEFRFRPGAVLEPFGHPPPASYSVARIAARLDADLVIDRLSWVDRERKIVHTAGGRELRFDAVSLSLGATARPRYEHAITFLAEGEDETATLIEELRSHLVKRIAFVSPERVAWPLPLYELALMIAARFDGDQPPLELRFITSERVPLEIFGEQASEAAAELLRERGVELLCSAHCEVPVAGELVVDTHPRLERFRQTGELSGPRVLSADRIVALPELLGPHVRGLPMAAGGFIPVDRFCRVRECRDVYAAGDATDFPVKHGSVAAQMGDTAARSIAALAGAPLNPEPFHPTIHGMLLTGGEPRYLSARISGGRAFGSRASDTADWTPPTKVAARYLGPFLEQLGSST
jgi:sulfide:quinone oxidoreductase